MPHVFMAVDCKKCSHHYCPVCERLCPKCGALDVADHAMEVMRAKMRLHMNRPEIAKRSGTARKQRVS